MKKIAIIVAHPDDAEIWMGGTILNHLYNGDRIKVVYLFAKEKDRVIEAKKLECNNLHVEILDDHSSLFDILYNFKPTSIVTHWEKDSHPEHSLCFKIVSDLIPRLFIFSRTKFNFYSCDTYNSLGKTNSDVFTPDVYVNISDNWMEKCAIIRNHDSQPTDHWISMIETQNRIYGLRSYCRYAEGFIRNTTLGHSMINQKGLF